MLLFLMLVPLYLLLVLHLKPDSTWKLAFRDGAKAFLFFSLFFPCGLIVGSVPMLLANPIFGENSYLAGVFGNIGGFAAFLIFATLVNKKFPFF